MNNLSNYHIPNIPKYTTEYFQLRWLNVHILCTPNYVHICDKNWSRLVSLPRTGFYISNFVSKIFHSFLSLFYSKQIRGPVYVTKKLISCSDYLGRLTFGWDEKVFCPEIKSEAELKK